MQDYGATLIGLFLLPAILQQKSLRDLKVYKLELTILN